MLTVLTGEMNPTPKNSCFHTSSGVARGWFGGFIEKRCIFLLLYDYSVVLIEISILLFSLFHHYRSTFEVSEYIMYVREFVCIADLQMHEFIILTCNKYQIRPHKILQN